MQKPRRKTKLIHKDDFRDIKKSIYFLTEATKQNYLKSFSYLGRFYYFNQDAPRDINKSIHYLSLGANQNDSESQFMLGLIFFERVCEIDKAI